jgi:hypothetical protein
MDRRPLALPPSLPNPQLLTMELGVRSRMELGMRPRPRLHRSGDPATNLHSGIGELTALPWAFGPTASPRAAARRVSVSRPIFGSNAERAFSLHPSDSDLCFSALPACQTDEPGRYVAAGTSILLRRSVRNALAPPGAGLLASRAGPSPVGPVRSTLERIDQLNGNQGQTARIIALDVVGRDLDRT